MKNYSEKVVQNFHQQTFAHILIEEKNHVLYLYLNRPKAKNALSPLLVNELAYSLAYAHYNTDIWAVVLGAVGNVFCAGADLKAFAGSTEETNSTIPEPDGEILVGELFNKLYKPCIAKVTGDVYAGGFLLLCGCTQVVALDSIQLGLPEVKRGLFPMQVMASLLQIMPARKVIDWCIRGYNLPVKTAHEYNLVTHIATIETIDTIVDSLCTELISNSPSAIRLGLEAYDHIRVAGSEEQHSYLRDMLFKTLSTEDAQEGLTAFREKRSPLWQGK